MHSTTRFHKSNIGMSWDLAHVAITILLALFFLIFLFLFLTITAQSAQGQTSVPPTARQAANMPEFASRLAHPTHAGQATASPEIASRLAHPAQPRASFKNPGEAQARRGRPLDNNVLYENGPINGTIDAWTIGFGLVVSDSFTVVNCGQPPCITGFTFGAWLVPGDVLQSAEISITSQPFGGTTYFDGVVNLTQSGCVNNQYGYDVCTETGTFTINNLAQGTYWVTLQNAAVSNGDPVYWDENSGAGCQSPGCPSQADENSIGTIPSESFTVLGATTCCNGNDYSCPGPQPGFHDLHEFGADSSGLAINRAGTLYGTLGAGGSYGQGLLYDLAQRAGHWFFSSLYSFLGGGNGSSPDGVIVGPQGDLFGTASGGIQNCGSDGASYCGLIYQARPPANFCSNASCSWNETPIYQFASNTDAWGGGISTFDLAGNLYGISLGGGANGYGAVFELSPSQGGWREKILYSFLGGNDGAGPNSLLVGHDGNLYGTAGGGLYQYGVVFQLVPSGGGGWTENVLHAFTGGATDGWGPGGLIQDGLGNLYGLSTCYIGSYSCADNGVELAGVIFYLSPSDGGWAFGVLFSYNGECGLSGNVTYHGLTMDAAGNLYATEGGMNLGQCGPQGCYQFYCGGVLDVASGSLLVSGNADIFGNLTSDANGNLYGTTQTCGFGTSLRTNGMVWQYSP